MGHAILEIKTAAEIPRQFQPVDKEMRICAKMHGESAERGRASPFCVQSMLMQGYIRIPLHKFSR